MNTVEGKVSIKPPLSSDDLELIELFRKASPEIREGIKRILEPYKYRFEGKLVK